MKPSIHLFFWSAAACLGAVALVTPCRAGASPTDPAAPTPVPALTPDRPGFTNGGDIVLVGRTQAEGGIAQTRAASGAGGSVTTDYPELLLRRGLTPRLEFRIGLPDYAAVQGGSQGLGDGSIGLKYKFYQSRDGGSKASLIPAVTVPVGAREFTSHHVDPLLTLVGQAVSGSRWGISANIALADPSQNGGRVATAAPSASVTYQLTPALSTYGELYDSFAQHSAPIPIVDGGFTFLVNTNLQWDAEAGWGLGAGAPIRYFGGGVSVRF